MNCGGKLKKIINEDSDFALFLLLATGIVYLTSWGGDFVSDDIAGIARNPGLADFFQNLKSLSVTRIFHSFVYVLFGPRPFFYHVLSTVFHLSAVLAVYALIKLIIEKINFRNNLWIPRLTAFLFALHPVETEAVVWISGFPYLAYTSFLLLSFLVFVCSEGKNEKPEKPISKKSLLGAVFFLLALYSTEKAFMFPGILFVYSAFFGKLSWQKMKTFSPLLAIALLYALTLAGQFSGRVADVAPAHSGGAQIFNPLIQIPIAVYTYVKLFFWPFNLTLYHDFGVFPQWEYWLAVGVTTILIVVILFSFWQIRRGVSESKERNYKIIFFGLLWFVIALSPTLLPINIGWVAAERYVRFASIGFFLTVAVIVSELNYVLIKHWAFDKVVNKGYLFLGLGVVLSILTIKRNLEWRSQDTLWPATVRESPYSAYAWNNMGDYYGRRGDIENSIKSFERARELRPRYAEATHNLANAYLKINEATKAADLYKKALDYNPTLYQSYEQLGKTAFNYGFYTKNSHQDTHVRALVRENKLKSAEEYFLQSIKLNPDPLVDYLYLYLVYSKAGNEEKVEKSLNKARKLAGKDEQRLRLLQQVLEQAEVGD